MNEISMYCYSKKENASIGFGLSFDSTKNPFNSLGRDWIDEGLTDSFWENYHEFEPGIEKAKQLLRTNPTLTPREALYNVFGDFSISCEIDGKEATIEVEVDLNQVIYDMLEI